MTHNRIFRQVRNLMLVGFLVSLFGSSLIEGSTLSLIALGLFPLWWIPFFTTLTSIQDLSSAWLSGKLRNVDPGRLLVVCEISDCLLCGLALLALIMLPAHRLEMLLTYIILASFLPLIIDLAEEFYAQKLHHQFGENALDFNIFIYTLVPIVTMVIARPLGNFLITYSIYLLLLINLAASFIAIFLRQRAVSKQNAILGSGSADAGSSDEAISEEPAPARSPSSILFTPGPGSPLLSGLLAFANAVLASYLLIWVASGSGHAGATVAALLLVSGVSQTIAPLLLKLIMKFADYRTVMLGLIAASVLNTTGFLCVYLLFERTLLLSVSAFVYVFIATAAMSALLVAQVSARQVIYTGDFFANIMGWGHSAASAGVLLGGWVGFALNTDRDPLPALLVSVGCLLLGAGVLMRKPRPDSAAGSPQLDTPP